MSPQDRYYYIAMIAGMVIGGTCAQLLGFGGILKFVGAIIVGIPMGLLGEQIYKRIHGPE